MQLGTEIGKMTRERFTGLKSRLWMPNPAIGGARNNNSLSDVQKAQEVMSLQKKSDPQLKAILSSAQYDKLKIVRYQAGRWVTQKRLGWQ
jgi:hypothetical protein